MHSDITTFTLIQINENQTWHYLYVQIDCNSPVWLNQRCITPAVFIEYYIGSLLIVPNTCKWCSKNLFNPEIMYTSNGNGAWIYIHYTHHLMHCCHITTIRKTKLMTLYVYFNLLSFALLLAVILLGFSRTHW